MPSVEEPTEMAYAFQQAERARKDRERAERQRSADLDPERRDAATRSIEDDIARLTSARAHGHEDIQFGSREVHLAQLVPAVPATEEDSEHVMSYTDEEAPEGITVIQVAPTTTGREKNTPVAHPVHYNADPSGVECIDIVRHRNFNIGNAIKYLWRAGLKVAVGRSAREKEIEDLKKARWYLADEIRRLGGDPDDE